MIEFRSDPNFKVQTVQNLIHQKDKEEVQYYSYSNKDYWAFVSANEKIQLQKEGKLPANFDADDVAGADDGSSAYQSEDEQPKTTAKKVDVQSPKASAKKTSCLNKRTSKQMEKR